MSSRRTASAETDATTDGRVDSPGATDGRAGSSVASTQTEAAATRGDCPRARGGGKRGRGRGQQSVRWRPSLRCAPVDDVSAGDVATCPAPRRTEQPMIYPGVCCGHRDCVQFPVTTPKTMGWLWSLRETGGVKINRNWRPGAIPRSVAAIMEATRALAASADEQSSVATASVAKYSGSPRAERAGKPDGFGRRAGRGARQARRDAQEPPPVVSMTKHGGQYAITMNPVPYRDADGQLTWPRDAEPVRVRLRSRRPAAGSSGSSVDLELRMPRSRERRERRTIGLM